MLHSSRPIRELRLPFRTYLIFLGKDEISIPSFSRDLTKTVSEEPNQCLGARIRIFALKRLGNLVERLNYSSKFI